MKKLLIALSVLALVSAPGAYAGEGAKCKDKEKAACEKKCEKSKCDKKKACDKGEGKACDKGESKKS